MKVAIIGIGNVGSRLVEIILSSTKHNLELAYICSRDKKKAELVKNHSVKFTQDYKDILNDKTIDIIVESIGETNGISLEIAKSALSNGKHLVTPNKAMISKHYIELAKLASKNKVSIKFETAVGANIPILRSIGLNCATDKIFSYHSILNGTSNYILSLMSEEGCEFKEALSQAQSKGYAETDPTKDIEGLDALDKAVIMNMACLGIYTPHEEIKCQGIDKISINDIDIAQSMDYKIKLIASSKLKEGVLESSVEPMLVSNKHPLHNVNGVINGAIIEAKYSGNIFLSGAGAGADTTAIGLLSDIVEVKNNTQNSIYKFEKITKANHISEPLTEHIYIRASAHAKEALTSEVNDIIASCDSFIGHNKYFICIAKIDSLDTIDNLKSLLGTNIQAIYKVL